MIFKNKYEKKELIGKGGFGIIYKVLDKETNIFYALKFITIVEKKEIKEKEKEILIMKNLQNDFIIKLKDYFYDETYSGYCIVMELCDGNLKHFLNKYKPKGLPLKMIKGIFIQLNDALKTMLKKGFTHRDLKPENILIKYRDEEKTEFQIKLTDFGLSADDITSSVKYHSNAGDRKYMAPEVEKYKYNKKCDLWSLGVILYELYTNKYIFDSDTPEKIASNRYKGKIKETDNEMINKLLRKLIQVDIDKRIGWNDYFNDEFFNIKEKEENESFELNGKY
jgi:calcium-dependent protein kinase